MFVCLPTYKTPTDDGILLFVFQWSWDFITEKDNKRFIERREENGNVYIWGIL